MARSGTIPTGRTVAGMARVLEAALDEVGLTSAQYRLLGLIADGENAPVPIAALLAVSPPSITFVVDGLVARNMVTRSPHPSDGRRSILALTAAGATALRDADDVTEHAFAQVLTTIAVNDRRDARRGMTRWGRALTLHRIRSVHEGAVTATGAQT